MPIINSVVTSGIIPTGTKEITSNGEYDVSAFESASVNITPVTDSIQITPSTGAQVFERVGGYNPVVVDAVTSDIDYNIQPENIKSGVEILGVTGTYEGSGGGAERIFITPVSANDSSWEMSWIEGDDWENKVGEVIKFYGIDGEEVNAQYVDDADRYGPFTCVSCNNVDGVCTIQVRDAANYVFSMKYIKEYLNFAIYHATFGPNLGGNGPTLIPKHPKIGDLIPVYDPDGYSREDIIDGIKPPVYYSSSVQFPVFESGRGQHIADGPISVASVEYVNGQYSVKLQDGNGYVFQNIWTTFVETKQITENGSYNIEGYSNVNVGVSMPPVPAELNIVSLETTDGRIWDKDFENSTSAYNVWKNRYNDVKYSPIITISNYKNFSLYNDWTLNDEVLSNNIVHLYYGGFKANDKIYHYSGKGDSYYGIRFEDNTGRSYNFQNIYDIPDIGTNLIVGVVQDSYNSSFTIPVAVKTKYGKVLFYDSKDDYTITFLDNFGTTTTEIVPGKFFGPSGQFLSEYVSDYIIESIYIAFSDVSNGHKYAYTGQIVNGNCEFTDGQTNVYISGNNLADGVYFYSDSSCTTAIDTIMEVYKS